jgi:hypothetical protein
MPISRIFDSHDDAMAAIADLKQAGYWEEEVRTVARSAGEVTVDGLMRQGVARSRARLYVDRLNAGATLVLVDAPFGMAGGAMSVLERAHGGEAAPVEAIYEGSNRDPATPLSSALNLPVLSHNAAPLSRWLGIPVLSASQRPKASVFGLPFLLHSAAPLSRWLGMRVLSRNPAPLSSLLGIPLLSGEPAPLSSRMGRPVLFEQPAPLSARMGMRTLMNEPAPLSRWLGLPVLSKDRKRH